jgi:hypothetical protein
MILAAKEMDSLIVAKFGEEPEVLAGFSFTVKTNGIVAYPNGESLDCPGMLSVPMRAKRAATGLC